MKKTQMKKAVKIEMEHVKTFEFVKKLCQKNNCPSNKRIAKQVVKDHLAEDKNYYKKLAKIHKD